MNRMISILSAIIFVLIASSTVCAQLYDGIDIRVRAPQDRSTYGYAAFRFTLLNTGTDTREVRLVLSDSDGPITTLSGSVSVPAGSTVDLPIYQPAIFFEASSALVYVDGRRVGNALRLTASSHGVRQHDRSSWGWGGYGNETAHLVLTSNRVTATTSNQIAEIIKDHSGSSSSGYYGYSSESRSVERSNLVAAAWPDDWLEYTRYLAVVVTASEFEALPAGVRDALIGSVHAGGNLMILDGSAPQAGGLAALTDQYRLEWSQISDPSGSFTPWIAAANLGFGQIQWATANQFSRASSSPTTFLFDSWVRTIGSRHEVPSLSTIDRTMRVVDDLAMPRRMTFVFLVVFAILVCPVNLIFLAKTNRRTLLFITAPVLGILFSATVFIYGLLHDGISTSSRIVAITVLDQRNQIASTSTQLAFYAPLTPRGGLNFSNATEVTPMLGESHQRLGDGQRVSLNFGDTQEFRSGWIVPRKPAHFLLRTHEPRRERVLIERDDQGGWAATNGLGVALTSLTFCDPQGNIHTASSIAAGARASLQPAGAIVSSRQRAELGRQRGSYPPGMAAQVAQAPRDFLVPNTFIATTEAPLFAPRGIESVKDLNAKETIYGILADDSSSAEAGQ